MTDRSVEQATFSIEHLSRLAGWSLRGLGGIPVRRPAGSPVLSPSTSSTSGSAVARSARGRAAGEDTQLTEQAG
jgi:hypothetical protein